MTYMMLSLPRQGPKVLPGATRAMFVKKMTTNHCGIVTV